MDQNPTRSSSPSQERELGGSSLIDAILNKYGDMESGVHDMGDVQVYFRAPAKKTKDNELGEASSATQSTLRLPRILVLHRCKICRAGDRSRIAELCRSVQELDLAENSLSCWNEILGIIGQFPNLELLNLSSNPLHLAPPLATSNDLVTIETIRRLVLNKTRLPWETVHNLLRVMPRLEELHLSFNDFSTVTVSPVPHLALKLLQFNSNNVIDWQEVQKLGAMFPELETLVLMHNQIQRLDDPEPERTFSKLKMLCLSETLVDSWEELEKMNRFPSLTEVLVPRIPLLVAAEAEEGEERIVRQLVIARLGKLTRLNRSRITETEREEAERMFIRKFKNCDVKPRRWEELVAKHGHLPDLAEVDLKPRKIFTCKLECNDQTRVIEVNVELSVLQFKKRLAQIVGEPDTKFRLFRQAPDGRVPEHLAWPKRLLLSYDISDEDVFSIY